MTGKKPATKKQTGGDAKAGRQKSLGGKGKSGRERYDWETIHKEYRSGTFSDAELARRHGCSRTAIQKKAKQGGWIKDLTEAVRVTTNAKLVAHDAKVAAEVAGENAKSAIDSASDLRLSVIQLHRQDIRCLRELETKLIAEIDNNPTKLYITQYQGQIIEKEVGLTAAERALAANNLANVQHKRIQLERQAFSIDDKARPIDPVDAITIELVAADEN